MDAGTSASEQELEGQAGFPCRMRLCSAVPLSSFLDLVLREKPGREMRRMGDEQNILVQFASA